ncbi:MAG TPA: MFS transporter [Ktedonobacteraceae bacterium]|nr:MFS transporter [Ktedonobacteraceae bacterium]
MKTEQRDDTIALVSLSPVEDAPVGSFRRVLKNRSFLLLWLAQLLSQSVFNAANYGVIAIVTAVTHSTVMVGLAIVSFTLPAVPFSLLAGVYVDYLDKRLVLWVSNALRAVTTGLIVVALLWNPQMLVPLYFLTFMISLVTQFFTPAEASAIPLLVSKHDLAPALSLFNITLTAAQALGFLVLGGLLTVLFPSFHLSFGFLHVQVQSFDMLFALAALVYLICAFLILAIPKSALRQEQRTQPVLLRSPGKQSWKIIRHDVKEAWDDTRKDHKLLLSLLRVSFVSILLLVIGEVIGPFVVNVLHLPVQAMPIILAPGGLGLVLGGLLMPALTRRLGQNRTITLGSLCTAACLILIPLGHFLWLRLALPTAGILYYVGAVTFILGVALDMVNIPAQTVMQEQALEEERGRLFSFQSMLFNAGSIPVLLFAGVIGDTLGSEAVMYILATAILCFCWWAARYSHRAYVS